MKLKLVSHVNGDGDLLDAWFRYYRRLGITSFHLIVHGSRQDNARLFDLADSHSVVVEDCYEGPFDSKEKKRRLDSLLAGMRGQWLLLVDSDEFVEFPYRRLPMMIRMLELAGANTLYAPMVQRVTSDGTLNTPDIVENPFLTFPLCSVNLYQKMGVLAFTSKYPLFYCDDHSLLTDGGNHRSPNGNDTVLSSLRGVTHHFKFRSSVSQRLDKRIHSLHPWRHESAQFQRYLESHAHRLPTEGSFEYSRDALFRRGLLRKFTFSTGLRYLHRAMGEIPKGKDARNP